MSQSPLVYMTQFGLDLRHVSKNFFDLLPKGTIRRVRRLVYSALRDPHSRLARGMRSAAYLSQQGLCTTVYWSQ
jgi:hypothetical protein